MAAPWQQAIDNANAYSSMKYGQGVNFTQGITPEQLARLKQMGVDTSGLERVAAWQNQLDPIKWQGELGRENLMYNEGRNQVVDLLQQGNQSLAAGQLNQTGEQIQANRGLLAQQLNQTGQGYYDAGQRLTKGYDTARREVQNVGNVARGDLLDREKQANSAARAGLAARGLNSTTLGVNAQRGIASDTNRGLNDLGERMAGLRSGIAERGAQARYGADSDLNRFMQSRAQQEYGAGSDLADFMLRRTGIETGMASDRINTLNQNRYQYDPTSRLAMNAQVGAAYPKQRGIIEQVGSGLLGSVVGGVGTALGGAVGGAAGGLFTDLFKRNGAPSSTKNSQRYIGPRYPGQDY